MIRICFRVNEIGPHMSPVSDIRSWDQNKRAKTISGQIKGAFSSRSIMRRSRVKDEMLLDETSKAGWNEKAVSRACFRCQRWEIDPMTGERGG
jgi:hypothetical protein